MDQTELERLRTQAAEVHGLFMAAKVKLDAMYERYDHHPPENDPEAKFLSDDYNSLNTLSSSYQHRLRELERQEAEKTKYVDEQAIATDFGERSFWFRRFHTSLAIAHGAAFAAVGSHLFDKDTTAAVAAAAWHPMALFACGMVVAGALPIALHRRSDKAGWRLATVSAALFVAGIAAALFAVWRKAALVLPV